MPAFAVLFILAIEFLGINVRQSESIKGIRIDRFNVVHKIKQYADDTTFLLNGMNDYREILSKIKFFSKISGLELNTNKTYAMKIGNFEEDVDQFEQIKFVSKIKLLGIWFSRLSSARSLTENWEGKINRLERTLAMWSRHKLTIIGKVLIIKVFGLSLFIYIMKSIGLPLAVLQRINRMFFTFIWKRNFKEGRTFERVKRKILCYDTKYGGLKMIDIQSMQACFMIKWCVKLIIEKEDKWAALPIRFMYTVGGFNTFLCDLDKKYFRGLDTIKSEFWKEALSTWLLNNGAKKFLEVDKISLRKKPIFNNQDIKYQGKSLYFEETINNGIFLVEDMITDNGTIMNQRSYVERVGQSPRAFLDHFVVYNALLNKRDAMDQEEGQTTSVLDKAKSIMKLSNKQIRISLEDTYKEKPCGRKLWERKFEYDVIELYRNNIKCTKEVKLRELAFKIFHNICSTNLLLHKIGIKTSNKCDFCLEVDYLDHSLVECMRLQEYWDQVIFHIENETGIQITNNTINKLFGINYSLNDKRSVQKANLYLLLAKFAIIKAKYYKIENVFSIFVSEIDFRNKSKELNED